MKRLMVGLLGLLLTASAAMAENTWGLGGSVWAPADGDTGYGVGAKLSLELAPPVMVDVRGAWFDDLGEDRDDLTFELEVFPVEGGLSVMLPVGENLEVYLGGGLGYYIFESEVRRPGLGEESVDPDDEIGFYAVGGFELTLSRDVSRIEAKRATFFAEVIYRDVEIDAVTLFDGTVVAPQDASFAGLGGTVGLALRW